MSNAGPSKTALKNEIGVIGISESGVGLKSFLRTVRQASPAFRGKLLLVEPGATNKDVRRACIKKTLILSTVE